MVSHWTCLKNGAIHSVKEGGDFELISLTALLHDIADHKYNNNNFEIGATKAFDLLISEGANQELAQKVASLINIISFKGGEVSDQETSLEGKIVRDADRLDAIGAIGIARAFAYGGSKSRPLLILIFLQYCTQQKKNMLSQKVIRWIIFTRNYFC